MWNIWEALIGFAIRDVITNLDIMNDNFFYTPNLCSKQILIDMQKIVLGHVTYQGYAHFND